MIRSLTDRIGGAADGRGAGERPSVGTTARAVAEDVRDLVRAEVALAKAELTQSVRAKAAGAALLIGAAVAAWLGLQGLLIAAGFALALVMPGWAAALVVAGALLALAAVAGLVGRRRLATPMDLETTKSNVEEDVEWVKQRLPKR